MFQRTLKRVAVIGLAALFVFALALSWKDDANCGQKPATWSYSNSYSWRIYIDTLASGAGVSHDTISVIGTGLAPPFYFTGLGPYSTIEGYIYAEVETLDTTVSGESIDTSKDSMIYVMYTACESDHSPKRVVEIESLLTAGSAGDTVWFSIADDSGICNEVFFYFITAVADSDFSLYSDTTPSGDSAGVLYKVTTSMTAK